MDEELAETGLDAEEREDLIAQKNRARMKAMRKAYSPTLINKFFSLFSWYAWLDRINNARNWLALKAGLKVRLTEPWQSDWLKRITNDLFAISGTEAPLTRKFAEIPVETLVKFANALNLSNTGRDGVFTMDDRAALQPHVTAKNLGSLVYRLLETTAWRDQVSLDRADAALRIARRIIITAREMTADDIFFLIQNRSWARHSPEAYKRLRALMGAADFDRQVLNFKGADSGISHEIQTYARAARSELRDLKFRAIDDFRGLEADLNTVMAYEAEQSVVPEDIDVIIILGSMDVKILDEAQKIFFEKKARNKELKIVTSGGIGRLTPDAWKLQGGEGAVYKNILRDTYGVEDGDVFVENTSQNTNQNLQFTRDILLREGILKPGTKIRALLMQTPQLQRRSQRTALREFEREIGAGEIEFTSYAHSVPTFKAVDEQGFYDQAVFTVKEVIGLHKYNREEASPTGRRVVFEGITDPAVKSSVLNLTDYLIKNLVSQYKGLNMPNDDRNLLRDLFILRHALTGAELKDRLAVVRSGEHMFKDILNTYADYLPLRLLELVRGGQAWLMNDGSFMDQWNHYDVIASSMDELSKLSGLEDSDRTSPEAAAILDGFWSRRKKDEPAQPLENRASFDNAVWAVSRALKAINGRPEYRHLFEDFVALHDYAKLLDSPEHTIPGGELAADLFKYGFGITDTSITSLIFGLIEHHAVYAETSFGEAVPDKFLAFAESLSGDPVRQALMLDMLLAMHVVDIAAVGEGKLVDTQMKFFMANFSTTETITTLKSGLAERRVESQAGLLLPAADKTARKDQVWSLLKVHGTDIPWKEFLETVYSRRDYFLASGFKTPEMHAAWILVRAKVWDALGRKASLMANSSDKVSAEAGKTFTDNAVLTNISGASAVVNLEKTEIQITLRDGSGILVIPVQFASGDATYVFNTPAIRFDVKRSELREAETPALDRDKLIEAVTAPAEARLNQMLNDYRNEASAIGTTLEAALDRFAASQADIDRVRAALGFQIPSTARNLGVLALDASRLSPGMIRKAIERAGDSKVFIFNIADSAQLASYEAFEGVTAVLSVPDLAEAIAQFARTAFGTDAALPYVHLTTGSKLDSGFEESAMLAAVALSQGTVLVLGANEQKFGVEPKDWIEALTASLETALALQRSA